MTESGTRLTTRFQRLSLSPAEGRLPPMLKAALVPLTPHLASPAPVFDSNGP